MRDVSFSLLVSFLLLLWIFCFLCGLKPCNSSWWHRDVSVSFTFTVDWNPVPVLDDTEMSVSFFLCGLHYSPWRHAEMSVPISFFRCGLKPCNPVSLHSDTVVPVKVLLFTMDWNCVISRTHHDDPELSSFTSSLSLIHGWKSQLVFILKFAFLISHWCRGESLGWYFMLKSAFLICHWYMGENLSWYLHWNLHFRFVINTWVKKSQLVLIFRSGFLICHWYTGEKVSVGIYTKICMSEAWNIEKFCLSSLIIKPWCKTKNSRHDPKFFHALQDSVTAIPYNEWTSEFIRPRIICIRINGV